MPKKTRTRSQSRARAPKDMLGNFDDPDYLKLKIEMTKADNDQKNSKMKQIFDKACEHWIVNKREADKWEQECNKLDENLNQLKMDNFGMSTKIEELESSITNILKENQQHSEENEETKTKLILAEKKIEELETVKTSMNRKLKEDAETKKYYDELLADTDKEISEYKERIKKNNKHIKELKEQVTELEGVIGEQVHLKDRVGKLEDENSGLKLTITSLNKTIEDLKSHDINEIRNMYNLTDDLDITVDNTPLVQLRKSLVFQNSCSEKTLSDELYENTQVENAIDLDITTSQDFIVRSPKTKTTNKTLTQPVKITTPIQQPSRPPTSPLPQAQPPSQVQPLPHAEPVTLHSSSTSSQFKCMLIGDSHARELKTHLENTGNKQCNYFVKCSPGASFTKLQADPKIILGENDFMILLGGTNDIFKTPVLDIEQHLIQTLRVNSTQMKTIVVSIPFRYSKPSVNKHIKLVNKKIRTVVDAFKNSVFFDINRRINKKHYANDKFHLNRSGKIKLSEGLNKIINKKSIFEDKNKGPTDTQNKKINTKASQENHSRQNRTENEDKNKNKKALYSHVLQSNQHQQKQPTTKTKDVSIPNNLTNKVVPVNHKRAKIQPRQTQRHHASDLPPPTDRVNMSQSRPDRQSSLSVQADKSPLPPPSVPMFYNGVNMSGVRSTQAFHPVTACQPGIPFIPPHVPVRAYGMPPVSCVAAAPPMVPSHNNVIPSCPPILHYNPNLQNFATCSSFSPSYSFSPSPSSPFYSSFPSPSYSSFPTPSSPSPSYSSFPTPSSPSYSSFPSPSYSSFPTPSSPSPSYSSSPSPSYSSFPSFTTPLPFSESEFLNS
ncbi:hypothetical protein M8J75_002935 [Diaphorina citri]|nr:hypothetical protein M8J75_010129 [Diaphorina citri]KAI5711764.1 hypothetical protein M8J75_002935 [Diaphorina citri]